MQCPLKLSLTFKERAMITQEQLDEHFEARKEAPIVECFRLKGKSDPQFPGFFDRFVFRCQHCKINHYHGAGNGHRAAHCFKGSPYLRTGYVLKEVGEAPQEETTNGAFIAIVLSMLALLVFLSHFLFLYFSR